MNSSFKSFIQIFLNFHLSSNMLNTCCNMHSQKYCTSTNHWRSPYLGNSMNRIESLMTLQKLRYIYHTLLTMFPIVYALWSTYFTTSFCKTSPSVASKAEKEGIQINQRQCWSLSLYVCVLIKLHCPSWSLFKKYAWKSNFISNSELAIIFFFRLYFTTNVWIVPHIIQDLWL